MDIDALVNITSRSWALPILAAFHTGIAGRQAPLLAATGAGRTAFGQSMEHLIDIGLVERNPGHGHPLRPEFRLTEAGRAAAAVAARVQAATGPDDAALLRKTWTLPILTTLQAPRRFNEIGRALPDITDRALSQSLRALELRHWVSRRVEDRARPPRSLYRAINTGERLSRVILPDIRAGM